MSLRSPFAAGIERGSYSAIVYKEGDLIIAEDDVGTGIKEGFNAATVIQTAIDSCGNAGKVILADQFDTDAELTFPAVAFTSFTAGIILQGYGNKTGINYTPASGFGIKLEGQSAVLHCAQHILDNFLITAPNTVDAAIGVQGGVLFTTFRDIKIYNVPDGKGIYIKHDATYGGNDLSLYEVLMYNCKYGLYATGGPALYIYGGKFITGMYSGVPTALEALYYTVTGHTSDSFKELHTTDLEILSLNTGQRQMYVKGDTYFFSTHHHLYDDAQRPIYIDGGRHAFQSCSLGQIEWSVGTQIVIDQISKMAILETKDPMVGLEELQTPFRIDANSPFINHDGTANVVDASAANGKCVQLDAQTENLGIYYAHVGDRMNKYLGVGKYLMTVYAKDTNQVANDLKIYVQANEGGAHNINVTYHTLTASYNAIPYSFTLASADIGDAIILFMRKDTAAVNTISIDYITVQQVGTNFHQSLGGGHQFLYLLDAGTLPLASASFRGVIGFQPGVGGVADTLKMCIKSVADTYSWKTIVTG